MPTMAWRDSWYRKSPTDDNLLAVVPLVNRTRTRYRNPAQYESRAGIDLLRFHSD